jgi:hypothetical protein
LAGQFNVTPEAIQDLRANKRGWGETTIELAMAQHLMQTDANTYPTMAAALNRIETLRSQKMGWGKIANYFGFKLGPVVSTAQHVRNELRRESRPEKPNFRKAENSGKPETATAGGTGRTTRARQSPGAPGASRTGRAGSLISPDAQ